MLSKATLMENNSASCRTGWWSSKRLGWSVGLAVLALAALRVWFAGQTELIPEEAYYWMYGQSPALSYYDHPPLVAWAIRAGTDLLGHSELGVRLLTVLLGLASGGLVFLLAQNWFGTRTGWLALALYSVLPIFGGTGFLAMPDGPLVFYWLATLWALTRAMDVAGREPVVLLRGRQRAGWAPTIYWLVAGIACGAALLAKYTAVVLGVSLLLFFWCEPRYRFWLRRPQSWLALVAAVVVFLPVVWWNAENHWASFLFQSTRTAGNRWHPWRNQALFWLMQLGILTPPFFLLLAATLRQAWQQRRRPDGAVWSLALAFALPMFGLFALASLCVQIHINWTAPAFLSLLPVAARWFELRLAGATGATLRRWQWLGSGSAVTGALSIVAMMGVLAYGGPFGCGYPPAGGWRHLANAVETAEKQFEAETRQVAFIIGVDKYNLAAELGFYAAEPAEYVNTYAVGDHGLGFRYWTDLPAWEGQPALAVLTRTNSDHMARLSEYFEDVGPPRLLTVVPTGMKQRQVFLAKCYCYRPQGVALAQSASGR